MQWGTSTLAVCGVAVLCVLAGCSGNGSPPPVETPTVDENGTATTPFESGTATPFEPGVADTERGRAILDVIRGRDLPVQSVETRNRTVHLTYEATNGSRDETVFFLALAYGEAVDDTWSSGLTWNASRMDAVALDGDGTPVARFRMPAYWARQTAERQLNATELAARLRNATETVRADTPDRDERTGSFRSAVTADADGTVTEVDRRGRTVFLTIETDTDDETLERTLGNLTATYGTHVDRGWNTTAMEVTIRGPDGDLYGWYRADADLAVDAASGNESVTADLLDAIYPEDDALESSP
ncbi:hypothetical protein [Halorientalis salina]|uniref:hypothetical protein n=1 Tax=Halorientalis salina TaxID=2932266 RepID=UPI0010AC9080|nr:hypothetical protein [Halorientalis salina]